MRVATSLLTVEEFNAKYARGHGYEYWFGEVVEKGMLPGYTVCFR